MKNWAKLASILLCLLVSDRLTAQFCSGTTSLVTISGILSDGSGPSDYANNSDCSWLIQPPAVSSITLTFTFFDLQAGDAVRVYDGTSAAAPLLGTFTGSSLPASITTAGPALFVRFQSNSSTTAEGWTAIYSTTSNGLYWIGDGGDWNDPAHWSTSSGGVSCGCVPTANDNVFFDGNSFSTLLQTVNIDADAYCKSMDWTGTNSYPLLDGTQDIFVYGSLILSSQQFISFSGRWYFEAPSGTHVIRSEGQNPGTLYFQGLDATWELLDPLECSIVYHFDGNLRTNNFDCFWKTYSSTGSNSRSTDWGTSEVTLTNTSSAWSTSGSGYQMDASQAHFIFTSGSASSFPSLNAVDAHVFKASFYGLAGNVTNVRRIDEVHFYGSATGRLTSNDTVGVVIFDGAMSLSGSTMLINQLLANQGGTTTGSHTIQNLTLTEGFTYSFQGGQTTNLPGPVNIQGTCSQPITLTSSSTTSNAIISRSSGSINIDQVRLNRISATGGAVFNATNTIPFETNPGWNITTPAAQTLYWVGDDGLWNDAANWSASSGGVAAGCIPTVVDEVVFDANSFSFSGQGVHVDETAYCSDMNWTSVTNEPKFSGSEDVHIYGSLLLHPDINYLYTGDLRMRALSGTHQFLTAGHYITDVFFEGAGNWQFAADVQADYFAISGGNLSTNGFTLDINGFYSPGTASRSCDLGTSTVYVQGTGGSWSAGGVGLTVDAAEATLISEYLATPTNFLNVIGNHKYGEIIFNGNYGRIQDADSVGLANFTGSGIAYLVSVDYVHNLQIAGGASFTGSAGTFRTTTIAEDASFSSSSSFLNLTLAAGKTFTFSSSFTTTISGAFTAIGNCREPITFKSTSATNRAKISRPAGSLVLDYAILESIEAIGGASFIANNSVDAGNNLGWTINSPASQTLYWVDGSGDWTDVSHWALSSGGTGGACLPTELDDVVFDVNSFNVNGQGVNIDQEVSCRDMTWNNSAFEPALYGTSDLFIFGSLELSPDMELLYNGNFRFASNTNGQTIQSAGHLIKEHTYFNGNGSWTLLDEINTNAIIYLNKGSLFTNSQAITAAQFVSTGSAIRSVNLGSSELKLATNWNVSGSNVSVSATNATFRLSGASSIFSGGGFSYGNLISEGPNITINNDNSIIDVDLQQNGTFSGTNTIARLHLAPNYTYRFQSGRVTTIVNLLDASGVPGGPVEIKSTSTVTRSTIHKVSGAVCLDYIQLEDMAATGSAFFFAGANSINVDNNVGWFFTSCSDACPKILDVATTFVGPTTATLDWFTPVANFQYQVRYREMSSVPWTDMSLIPGAHDRQNLTGLNNTSTYEWQVRQVCEPTYTLVSEWSDTLSFMAKCYPPTKLATDIILSKAVRVQWERASEAAYYEIRGRRVGDPSFTGVNLPKFPFYFDKTGLSALQTFEWQMRTFCEPGGTLASDWSTLNVFTTPSGRVGEEVEVSVYPNPFGAAFSVSFDKAFEEPTPVVLIDLTGRVLYQTTTLGAETLRIERNELPTGNYFLQIGGADPETITLSAH